MTKLSVTQMHKGVVRITPAPKAAPDAAPSYEPNLAATAPTVAEATTHPITSGAPEAVVQHPTTSPEEAALTNVATAEEKAAS